MHCRTVTCCDYPNQTQYHWLCHEHHDVPQRVFQATPHSRAISMGADNWRFCSDWLALSLHKSPKAGKSGGIWHRHDCHERSDSDCQPSDGGAEEDKETPVVDDGNGLRHRFLRPSLVTFDGNSFRTEKGFCGRPDHRSNLLHHYRSQIKEGVTERAEDLELTKPCGITPKNLIALACKFKNKWVGMLD